MSEARMPMVLFRAMLKDAAGRPKCGSAANHLGVRIGVDIKPDETGTVAPGMGGLSVTPDDPSRLPPHVRPARLGGCGALPVFRIQTGTLPTSLTYRPDQKHPRKHGLVEPARVEHIDAYQADLSGTGPNWDEEVT
jgi:hypothetical protein